MPEVWTLPALVHIERYAIEFSQTETGRVQISNARSQKYGEKMVRIRCLWEYYVRMVVPPEGCAELLKRDRVPRVLGWTRSEVF